MRDVFKNSAGACAAITNWKEGGMPAMESGEDLVPLFDENIIVPAKRRYFNSPPSYHCNHSAELIDS
jgi:hypothetical protein